MVVVVAKNPILRIAIKRINKTFSVPKDNLDAQFDIISTSFRQLTQCLCRMQSICHYCKQGLKLFCDLFEIKHTEFFILVRLLCITT